MGKKHGLRPSYCADFSKHEISPCGHPCWSSACLEYVYNHIKYTYASDHTSTPQSSDRNFVQDGDESLTCRHDLQIVSSIIRKNSAQRLSSLARRIGPKSNSTSGGRERCYGSNPFNNPVRSDMKDHKSFIRFTNLVSSEDRLPSTGLERKI